MSLPVAADTSSANEARVSARTWIKLFALCLFTICLLIALTEVAARLLFPAGNTAKEGEDCMVLDSGTDGVRGIPNCVISEKPLEGELSDYHFNSSGYRNDHDFAPKSPGTFRIVTVGTSMAAGLRVPQEKTFGALLPLELSQRTGRKVELYNLGLPWRSPASIAHHMDEAIALQPDMILWALTPQDVWNTSWIPSTYEKSSRNAHLGKLARIKAALTPQALMARVSTTVNQMRTLVMLRNVLYSSPSLYVQSALLKPGYNKDFLLTKPSPKWQTQLGEFESSAAEIEEKCSKAGVPFAAVLIPDRTQVAMVSMMGDWPRDLDPYKLDRDLRSIVTSHGGTYIEILGDFRTIPNPETEYMAVDGHPNAAGHASIANFLTNKLAGTVALGEKGGLQPQAGLLQPHLSGNGSGR